MQTFIFHSLDFLRGNTINIIFAGTATVLWFVQKAYYKYLNARNERKWAQLSDQEKEEELKQVDQKIERQ